jgi:hypothetical protein
LKREICSRNFSAQPTSGNGSNCDVQCMCVCACARACVLKVPVRTLRHEDVLRVSV